MNGTPTEDFLQALQETLALGYDATLAMLGGAPLDAGILVPTLSAAALLATHPDLAADPQVQGTLAALQTAPGRRLLTTALPKDSVAALPELTATMAYEDKVELLREAIELGALTTYADSNLQPAIAAYLDRLEVHVLAHGDAHADLGEPAELLGNVAAFAPEHPVSTLLAMVRAGEAVADRLIAPAKAVDLVRQAIARFAAPPSLWSRWFEATKRRLIQTGQDLTQLLTIPAPTPNMAYAAGPDDIDEHRVQLTQSEHDEVNIVFRGDSAILEWQGAGEAPVEARIAASTVLSDTEQTTTVDLDQRVRWPLSVPPGDGGTVVTLRFASGRALTLEIPGV